MFGAGVVPAFAFLCLLFFVPESPRWLVKSGQSPQARTILARVGGEEYADAEIRDIEQTISADEKGRVRFSDMLDRRILPILLFGIFLAAFQQWCGLNVFLLYAEEVFRSAGYDISGLMFNIVITGIINLVFTFVAIVTIDRWGRRPLMLFGAGSLAILHAILGYCFFIGMTGPLMLVLVLAFIACFAMTLGPTVWVVLAEIFPNRIRGAAMSLAVASLWVANLILTQTFPILNSALKAHGTFWIYGGICAVSFVIILLKLPETKGKSLEEIEAIFYDKPTNK
jgi:SP family sugar porter-like MFS transporter